SSGFPPADEQDLVHGVHRDQARSELQRFLQPQTQWKYPVVPAHCPLALMRHPPYGRIEQEGGARLHTEHAAPLDAEVMCREFGEDRIRRVAALVSHELIE